MPSTTLTLGLEGEVTLELFARAMSDFSGLVHALKNQIDRKTRVEWVVESLEAGSAVTQFRGESDRLDVVERTVQAYGSVGRSLSERRSIPYSYQVIRRARKLESLLDGKIEALRFETADEGYTVVSPESLHVLESSAAYGSVEGRIEAIFGRGELRFTLFDALYDRAVSCYLREGQEEQLRGLWKKRAWVEGWVSRDAATGRPISVRDVSDIQILEEVPADSYTRVRGILRTPEGAEPPEAIIRRLRDAE